MISDVLADAIKQIRKFQREVPDSYDAMRQEIDRVVKAMDTLLHDLDTPPENDPRYTPDVMWVVQSVSRRPGELGTVEWFGSRSFHPGDEGCYVGKLDRAGYLDSREAAEALACQLDGAFPSRRHSAIHVPSTTLDEPDDDDDVGIGTGR